MNTPKPKTLKARVIAFLKSRPGERFTAGAVARGVYEAHSDSYMEKRAGFDTDTLFFNQLSSEIGRQRQDITKSGEVKTTEGIRPRLYFYSVGPEGTDGEELISPDEKAPGIGKSLLLEKDTYPLLAIYLRDQHNLYSKRIDEKRSSNKQGKKGNQWLYPDMVAMEPLDKEWEPDIIDCVSSAGDSRVKLWSFEVKRQLTRGNVRECFFQAVSNSSWANYGYLVTADIVGDVTRKELDLLCSLHGIGLIHLDVNDPTESQNLIPARERASVDWRSADRILKENKDFLEFIKNVKGYYRTSDLRDRDWEKVPPSGDKK